MHLEADPHPHPHPQPAPRRGLLPWLLIAAILAVATFLALRGGGLDDAQLAARFHHGVALLEQYRYAEAYEQFAAVARARPEWDAAHANAGLAALNLREAHLKAAEAHFREAVRLNPRNLHAHFGLGVLLKHQNRQEEAFRAFEGVARADPGDPHALYEYAAALVERERYAEARDALRAALRIQPAFSSALYRLSRVELALKNREGFDEALKSFKALDEHKEGITSGDIYGEGGKYYTAIRTPLPSARAAPSSAPEAAPPATVRPLPPDGASLAGPLVALTRPDGGTAPPALAVEDLDGDGHLDLVLGGAAGATAVRAQVWKGRGSSGGFQMHADLETDGTAAALGDLDGDGDRDLVLAREGAVVILENDGKANFTSTQMKLPLAAAGFPVEALVFDADSDWDLDILVARQVKDGERVETALALLNNNRDGSFEDIAGKAGLARVPFPARDVLFADLDGDIDSDILVLSSGGEGAVVFLNDRAFRYRRVPAEELGGLSALLLRPGMDPLVREALFGAPEGEREAQSLAALADVSGQPFLLQARAGGPLRIFPAGPAPESWIAIDLVGARKPTVGITWTNLSGIGATVEVRAGERVEVRQAIGAGAGAAHGPHRLYFDLHGARKADYVRILWPDGVLQAEAGLEANRIHRIEEVQRKPSSCPIVFAWDGSGFRYAADLLGVGGLGYLEAPGVYSRPDPTEVLELFDLAPASDPGGPAEYRIRIVEPLEECTYLDAVELWATDAPSGWTIHPQEIFAVRAPQPAGELLAFRRALVPERARDHRGRDVTAELRAVDRLYPEGWSRDRRFPGAAEPHAIVLEWGSPLYSARTGDSASLARPVLFLYGYVEYGYSTSNFAAAQAGVSLHAPTVSVERGGRWEPLREEWGFPAGTPRWMTVDLGGLLAPGDRRLRVETDMEVYWDQAFLAEAAAIPLGEIGRRGDAGRPISLDLKGAEGRITLLAPDGADLRYRGFPRDRSPDGRHPKVYDYHDTAQAFVMKPFPGRYTRYGSVADLLLEADDRFATFGEGDEVALTFRADRLPPLPAGWKRTFFLAAAGYCKDMDLYTAAGERVEPLPYRDMQSYPPPPGVLHPHTARASERAALDDRLVAPLELGRP